MLDVIFRKSLKIRLKVFFLLVGLLPLILSSLLFLVITKSLVKEMAYRRLQILAESAARDIARVMSRGQTGIKVLAGNLIVTSRTATQPEKVEEMRRIQRFYGVYDQVTLADSEGKVLASTGANHPENWATQDWFLETKGRKTSVSGLYLLKTSQAALVFAAPVLDSQGEVLYVIWGQMNLERIREATEQLGNGGSEYVTLVDKTGTVLLHPDKGMILKPINSPKLLERIQQNNVRMASYPLSDGTEVLAVEAPLQGEGDYVPPGWHVLAVKPASEAFALVEALQAWAWIMIGIEFLFVLFASAGLTQNIIKPVEALIAGARKITRGDLKNPVQINSQDELGTLNRMLNEIAEHLERHTAGLERLVQERTMELELKIEDRARKLSVIHNISQLLSSALNLEEVLQLAVAIVGRVLGADQCSLLFIERGNALVRSKYEYRQGESQTELININISLERYPELKKAIETKRPVGINDVQKDPLMDQVRDLLTSLGIRSILVFPLLLEDKMLGLLTLRWRKKNHILQWEEIRLGETIASQIAIALKSAQMATEGRRPDRTINEFTKVIVQDLKSPLAAIRIFSERLIQMGTKENRVQNEQFLRSILYYANFLLGRAHNILEVYEMEKGNLKLQEEVVPLTRLIETAVEQFDVRAEQEGVALISEIPENLPSVRVDIQLLTQVLDNILHNSIKHTQPGGKILLGIEKQKGGEIWIEVQMIGKGIPAKYLDKIFDKFLQVENWKTEAEVSMDLGFYFCKLAMEIHGGRIWVESQEGEGSTFYLALPPERIVAK